MTADGPAGKAGLKAGDRIVEIGGRPVTNIGTYQAIMGQQTPGQAVEVIVLRNNEKVKLKMTPQ